MYWRPGPIASSAQVAGRNGIDQVASRGRSNIHRHAARSIVAASLGSTVPPLREMVVPPPTALIIPPHVFVDTFNGLVR